MLFDFCSKSDAIALFEALLGDSTRYASTITHIGMVCDVKCINIVRDDGDAMVGNALLATACIRER